jgi:hypothetical protein
MRENIGVTIYGNDIDAGLEQRARISARAKRAINHATASKRRKRSNNLVQKDGDVRRIYHRGFGQVTFAHTDQNSTSSGG